MKGKRRTPKAALHSLCRGSSERPGGFAAPPATPKAGLDTPQTNVGHFRAIGAAAAQGQEIFTAAEIGKALNWSKGRVQEALESAPSTGSKDIRGKDARAWSLAALPSPIAGELERIRGVHFHRSVGQVLRDPPSCWAPRVPLARVAEKDRLKAHQLQKALCRALALPDGCSVSERVRLAAEDSAVGDLCAVGEGQLRALIIRTIDRDRGARAWHRLELYLPDSVREKRPAARPLPSSAFADLEEELGVITDHENTTPEDRAYCWRKVVDFFESRVGAVAGPSRLKRELRAWLLTAAPFLAESAQAMKRNFNRKLSDAAKEGISALTDQRTTNSGRRHRPEDWEANIQLFARWTLIRHGRESQAWRELHLGTTPTGDQFSQGFRDYYGFDVRTAKSRVPSSARDAIRPIMKATAAHQLGPRAVRLARPCIRRDWSDTAAGDYFTADDVTINHLWFEWHEFGDYEFEGHRFNVGRGQWLICCDERTDFPLGFLLMPSPTYNSSAICTLNSRIFTDERVGLPFKGMKYEQGIWKARNIAAQFEWPKISDAFARHGIELALRHATTPRAKIVERVIGTAQNMMDHLPGYIGRCEAKVKFEREQKFLQSLKRTGQPRKAEVDPRELLLSKEQISDELVKVMRAFAAEPQNGERLSGLSPAEAWEQLSPAKPHQLLPESLRYLLTTHQSEQTVSNNGVRVKIGGEWHSYVGSERLGELRGEKVRVFYNPELPEMVSVIHPRTDPKAAQPFCVPLFERVPANTPTREDFAKTKAHQRAFSKFGENAFRLIAPPRNLTMRNEGLGTPELRETGDRLNKIESEHRAVKNSRRRLAKELSALGHDPAEVKNPARVLEAEKNAAHWENECRRLEAEEAGANL